MCFLNTLLSPSLRVALSRLSLSQVNDFLQSASLWYSRLKQDFMQDKRLANHTFFDGSEDGNS